MPERMLEKSGVNDYATRVCSECIATHELMFCPSSRSFIDFRNVIFTAVYDLLLFITIKSFIGYQAKGAPKRQMPTAFHHSNDSFL